ncbi:outer membrane beta-barrel protein [Andreprevotia chitinilytica]|uniref:outer membrane beta-barrel protein n=1 Tax=Andreprevotia chitinilytica TaxID=396808 RepID=UPI0006909448|nr:outer membrane beta-barrel protein [Andreprevotia chitinilytica]
MKYFKHLLAAVAFGAATTAAFAGDTYLYGDLGQSTYQDNDAVNRLNPGASADKSDFGFNLGAGYRFNQNFAVEGGYLNLGKMNVNSASGHGDFKAQGLAFQAVGSVPLGDRFSVYGTLGLNPLQVKTSFPTSSSSGWRVAPSAGLGVGFKVNDQVGLRAGYARYFNVVDDNGMKSDADLLSAGLTYSFK